MKDKLIEIGATIVFSITCVLLCTMVFGMLALALNALIIWWFNPDPQITMLMCSGLVSTITLTLGIIIADEAAGRN